MSVSKIWLQLGKSWMCKIGWDPALLESEPEFSVSLIMGNASVTNNWQYFYNWAFVLVTAILL